MVGEGGGGDEETKPLVFLEDGDVTKYEGESSREGGGEGGGGVGTENESLIEEVGDDANKGEEEDIEGKLSLKESGDPPRREVGVA